jgi:hypothetical protein
MKFDDHSLIIVWIPFSFYRKNGVQVKGRGNLFLSIGVAASDLTEEKGRNSSYYDYVSFY